jgi:photosystem II stability/assembly factor-like uncharacterized protein
LVVVTLAFAATAAAAVVYAGPGLVRSDSQRTVPAARWELATASFGDADHGAVTMVNVSRPTATGGTYVTSNGGRTWTRHRLGLFVTNFVDRDHVVTVDLGPSAQFETSADAGRSWVTQPAPAGARQSSRIGPGGSIIGGPMFLDPENAWWLAAGPPGPLQTIALWRSRDGGRTWSQLAAGGIPSDTTFGPAAFVDQLRGVIVMPEPDSWLSLLTTHDGGETWQPVALSERPAAGAHLAQGLQNVALLIHGDRLVLSLGLLPAGTFASSFGPPGDPRNHVLTHWSSVSRDGGLTWTPWSPEPTLSSPLPGSPTFADDGRLLLADGRQLWTSGDDGRTWQAQSMQMPAGMYALSVLSARGDALFAAAWRLPQGSDNPRGQVPTGPVPAASELLLLRSRDGGSHWTNVPLPRP